MKTSVLIASSNKGKLIEMQALLQSLPITLVLPESLGIHLEIEENGKSYQENAALKGKAYCEASNLITLADDSGLEVVTLNGEPGLHSARFSGKTGASDADRRHYLLEKLNNYPRPWTAHFHCTIALAVPGKDVLFAEGNCPGEIIDSERGTNGFGYDPIFWLPEKKKTMAELNMEEKNMLSHRALAVRAVIPMLKCVL